MVQIFSIGLALKVGGFYKCDFWKSKCRYQSRSDENDVIKFA
jgi:predicted nucleic acid-binding Zn ribbon protein